MPIKIKETPAVKRENGSRKKTFSSTSDPIKTEDKRQANPKIIVT